MALVILSTPTMRAFVLACAFLWALGEAKLEATQFINIKPSGQLTHEKLKLVRFLNVVGTCISEWCTEIYSCNFRKTTSSAYLRIQQSEERTRFDNSTLLIVGCVGYWVHVCCVCLVCTLRIHRYQLRAMHGFNLIGQFVLLAFFVQSILKL